MLYDTVWYMSQIFTYHDVIIIQQSLVNDNKRITIPPIPNPWNLGIYFLCQYFFVWRNSFELAIQNEHAKYTT